MSSFTDYQLRIFEKPELECADVTGLLCDYQDSDLPQALQERVEFHIDECGYCQEVAEGYRLTIELASELEDVPVPTDVSRRLRQSLNEKLGLSLSLG